MAENQAGKDNWKNNVLKSSLPLEQIVSERLEKLGFYVNGEYAYIRPNEQDVETQFSVDLHVSKQLKRRGQQWASLNLLVECKYNYPGVRWVFAPLPRESLLVVGVISCLDDLSTECVTRKTPINRHPLYRVDNALPFCVRGIELNNSGFDANTILRGLSQLRYALPNLMFQEARAQITAWHEEDLPVSFICPMLATTASLYVLRSGLDLDAFHSASDLTDVAQEVDALIAYQETGYDLYKYSEQIAQTMHQQHPDIKQRLDEKEAILGGAERRIVPLMDYFNAHIVQERSRIIVVRLDALGDVVNIINDSVRKVGQSARKVAALAVDLEQREKHFVPITASSP